jgi:hypothetical protein
VYFILFGMPRGILSKVDMLARVYKLKNQVHDRHGKYHSYNDSQLHIANETLNDILDMLGEYSQ